MKVDNITSSFNIKKPILFKQLKITNQKFNFNPERFSGFFIKYTEGTAVLFQSGKINIIGCKTVTAITKNMERYTDDITDECEHMIIESDGFNVCCKCGVVQDNFVFNNCNQEKI